MDAVVSIVLTVLGILVLAEGTLVLICLRQVGLLAERLETLDLPNALQGPDGRMPMLRGTDLSTDKELVLTWPAQPALVVALTTNCGSCDEFVDALGAVRSRLPDLQIILAFLAEPADAKTYLRNQHLPAGVEAIAHPAFRRVLRVRATPYAFVVEGDGAIRARGITNTVEHVANLVHGSATDGLPRPVREIAREATA